MKKAIEKLYFYGDSNHQISEKLEMMNYVWIKKRKETISST